MEMFFFWIVMAVVVAIVANSKGRSPVAWFFYGFLIWPIALVHILVSKPTKADPADAGQPRQPDLVVKHQGREIRISRRDNSAMVDGLRFATPEDAQDYVDRMQAQSGTGNG